MQVFFLGKLFWAVIVVLLRWLKGKHWFHFLFFVSNSSLYLPRVMSQEPEGHLSSLIFQYTYKYMSKMRRFCEPNLFGAQTFRFSGCIQWNFWNAIDSTLHGARLAALGASKFWEGIYHPRTAGADLFASWGLEGLQHCLRKAGLWATFALRLVFNISKDLQLKTSKTYVVILNSVLYCHLQSVHSGSTPVSFWYGRNRVTILSSQF